MQGAVLTAMVIVGSGELSRVNGVPPPANASEYGLALVDLSVSVSLPVSVFPSILIKRSKMDDTSRQCTKCALDSLCESFSLSLSLSFCLCVFVFSENVGSNGPGAHWRL